MVSFDYRLEPGMIKETQKEYLNYKKVISIITPTWNAKSTIYQTVNCILNQTYPFFEWIIVDDGSTDKESLKILKDIEKMDDRIKIFHKKSEGPSHARDFGVKKAASDTEFLVFIDDDDLLDKTYLECAYYSMCANENAAWCYCDVVNFGKIESLWSKKFSSERMKYENTLVSQAMIRKRVYDEVGGFALEGNGHYEDWVFWLKLMAKGYFPIHMSFYGFWYRRKENSGEFNLAKKYHKRNMQEIKEYASKVMGTVTAIEYPRENYNWDNIKDKIDGVYYPRYKDNGKTNILVMVPWMALGGADKFNLDLFKMIDKNRYSITLLSMQPTEYAWRQKFDEVCDEVFDLSTFIDRKDWLSFVNYMIETRDIDIIFNTNSVTGYMMLPYLHAKYPSIPIIDYIHMEEWYNRNGGYSRDSAAVGSVIDRTLFCNANSERIMREHFKRSGDSLGTVYIGVDSEKFDPKKYDSIKLREKYGISQEKFVISLIARIDYQKRPYLLMRIIEETVKCGKVDNLLFLVAGDGPLLESIKGIAREKNLTDYVSFIGKTDNPDEIYAISDMTLNCSIKEGLALTSYESLAMGVPVLSCDVGGQKELIDDTCGVIVPCLQDETEIHNYDYSFEEVKNYVDGIIKIYKNIDKYRKNSRKRVLNGFTIKNMVVNMEKEFETLSKLEKEKSSELSKHTDVFKELINEYFQADKGIYNWLCSEYNAKVYKDDVIPINKKQLIGFKFLKLGEKLHVRGEFEIVMYLSYEILINLKNLVVAIVKIPYLLIMMFVKLVFYDIKRIFSAIKRKILKR